MGLNTALFNSYNLDERIKLINEQGEFITRIKFYGFFLNLYVVDNYLIEVYYNSHSNCIEDAELVDPKDDKLDLYISHVSITDVFNA